MFYSQWTHVHSLKQQIGTKKRSQDHPHKTVKFNSLRRGGLGNYGAWRKMLPPCGFQSYRLSLTKGEWRVRRKEGGGVKRDRDAFLPDSTDTTENVEDEEVCLQKCRWGEALEAKLSWAVLRKLQCQQLPCTALLKLSGSSDGVP